MNTRKARNRPPETLWSRGKRLRHKPPMLIRCRGSRWIGASLRQASQVTEGVQR